MPTHAQGPCAPQHIHTPTHTARPYPHAARVAVVRVAQLRPHRAGVAHGRRPPPLQVQVRAPHLPGGSGIGLGEGWGVRMSCVATDFAGLEPGELLALTLALRMRWKV
jgi:hypothetical protein